jgi:hypothetical protein
MSLEYISMKAMVSDISNVAYYSYLLTSLFIGKIVNERAINIR